MRIVLPAFGGETMSARCPLPTGQRRSTMRMAMSSGAVVRRIRSFGSTAVRRAKSSTNFHSPGGRPLMLRIDATSRPFGRRVHSSMQALRRLNSRKNCGGTEGSPGRHSISSDRVRRNPEATPRVSSMPVTTVSLMLTGRNFSLSCPDGCAGDRLWAAGAWCRPSEFGRVVDVHFEPECLIGVNNRFSCGGDLDLPIAEVVFQNGTPELAQFPGGELLPEDPSEVRCAAIDVEGGDPFSRRDVDRADAPGTIPATDKFFAKERLQIPPLKAEIVSDALDALSFDDRPEGLAEWFIRYLFRRHGSLENCRRGLYNIDICAMRIN